MVIILESPSEIISVKNMMGIIHGFDSCRVFLMESSSVAMSLVVRVTSSDMSAYGMMLDPFAV